MAKISVLLNGIYLTPSNSRRYFKKPKDREAK